jgi:hypothetical protein
MTGLAVLGGELLLFALSLLIMRAVLRRSQAGGLFVALPWGSIPALFLAVLAFAQIQQKDLPEVKEARQVYIAQAEHFAARVYSKPDANVERDEFRDTLAKVFEVEPALEFCFHLGILAALAAALRRRQAKLGLMPALAPLWQWTAPWELVWLILGPALLMFGAIRGLLSLKEPGLHAAWNILVVGLAVALFQGAVVFWAKLRSWWLVPASRPLVFIVLLGVFLSLGLQGPLGLMAFLLLTGLFEPWVDARRLRQPPPETGLKP